MYTKLGARTSKISRAGAAGYMVPPIADSTSTITSSLKCDTKFKDKDGTERFLCQQAYTITLDPASLSTPTSGMLFGSGDTPATENDYWLESMISSGISISKSPGSTPATPYYNAATNSIEVFYNYTITNTGSSDVVIKEVGVCGIFATGSGYGQTPSTSSSDRKTFLLERTVLDTPITIAPGTSGVVRYAVVYPGDEIA